MMTQQEVDAFLRRSIEIGKKRLLDSGHLMPIFHGFGEKYSFIIGAPWRGDEDKKKALMSIRLLFAIERVDAYSMLSETWVASFEGQAGGEDKKQFERWREQEKRRTGEWPDFSDYPRAKEVIRESLVILFVARGREPIYVTHPILRDANSKITGFGEPKLRGKVSGRMTELLPPPELQLSPASMAVAETLARVLGMQRLEER